MSEDICIQAVRGRLAGLERRHVKSDEAQVLVARDRPTDSTARIESAW